MVVNIDRKSALRYEEVVCHAVPPHGSGMKPSDYIRIPSDGSKSTDSDPSRKRKISSLDEIVYINDVMEDNRILKLYLISNECDNTKTKTHIGCVEDLKSRIDQHNGTVNGGPHNTRKAAGSWKLYLIILVPPTHMRNFSTKKLRDTWSRSGRGLVGRIREGILLAKSYDLDWFICREVLHNKMIEKTGLFGSSVKKGRRHRINKRILKETEDPAGPNGTPPAYEKILDDHDDREGEDDEGID